MIKGIDITVRFNKNIFDNIYIEIINIRYVDIYDRYLLCVHLFKIGNKYFRVLVCSYIDL